MPFFFFFVVFFLLVLACTHPCVMSQSKSKVCLPPVTLHTLEFSTHSLTNTHTHRQQRPHGSAFPSQSAVRFELYMSKSSPLIRLHKEQLLSCWSLLILSWIELRLDWTWRLKEKYFLECFFKLGCLGISNHLWCNFQKFTLHLLSILHRGSQKTLLAQRAAAPAMCDSSALKSSTKQSLPKPRPKQPKAKAEPPPKKRKKWKEEFTDSTQLAFSEAVGEDDGK